ncbi:MAG: hypothetical protein M3Y54_08810 [Bacteroidota bacterium]|nr:hypothetical protein [Bacteroidota bacterium]
MLLFVHAACISWALHNRRWDFPDSGRYQQAGLNIREHGQLYARIWPNEVPRGEAVQEFTIRPPGYPVVLDLLEGAHNSPWLVLLLQNVLSLLALGLVMQWWARIAKPLRTNWLGAVGLMLLFPAQLIYANAVMSELWLQACLLAAVGWALLFSDTGKIRYLLGVAVAISLALLLKPVCFPLAAVMAAVAGWLAWKRRRSVLLLVGLLPVLVAGIYMRWNEQRTGYFHFSSIAEINLLHYNAAGVVRQLDGPVAEEKWVAEVLRAANAQPDFAGRQRLIRDRADSVISAHPFVYARQHLLGMGTMLLDPGRFDISEFLALKPLPGGGLLARVRAEGWRQAAGGLPLGLLVVLGLLTLANVGRLLLAIRGFIRLGRGAASWRVARWLAVGGLGYLALLTGPLGAARFLVPAWPLLLGLALMGLRGPVAEQT